MGQQSRVEMARADAQQPGGGAVRLENEAVDIGANRRYRQALEQLVPLIVCAPDLHRQSPVLDVRCYDLLQQAVAQRQGVAKDFCEAGVELLVEARFQPAVAKVRYFSGQTPIGIAGRGHEKKLAEPTPPQPYEIEQTRPNALDP